MAGQEEVDEVTPVQVLAAEDDLEDEDADLLTSASISTSTWVEDTQADILDIERISILRILKSISQKFIIIIIHPLLSLERATRWRGCL